MLHILPHGSKESKHHQGVFLHDTSILSFVILSPLCNDSSFVFLWIRGLFRECQPYPHVQKSLALHADWCPPHITCRPVSFGDHAIVASCCISPNDFRARATERGLTRAQLCPLIR